MPSIKALAAIALTLMVAVPIGLGYALASTDTESTSWQADSTANGSDLLLNHQTPFFTDFIGSQNNRGLVEKQVAQGGTDWRTVAPAYVKVGSSATALPTYTTTGNYYTMVNGTTNSYSLSYSANNSVGTAGSGAKILISPTAANTFTISSTAGSIHWSLDHDGTQLVGLTELIALKDGVSTYTLYASTDFDTYTFENVQYFSIITDASGTVTNSHRGYTTLNISGDYFLNAPDWSSLVLKQADNVNTYVVAEKGTTISLTGTTAVVGSESFRNVSSISLAPIVGAGPVHYDVSTATGKYADPAAGWKLPSPPQNVATYDWWQNGQLNETARLMVAFSDDGYVYLGPNEALDGNFLLQLYSDDGRIYVKPYPGGTTQVLGQYDKAMVIMGMESATVYGITEWPTFGVAPTTYNSVTVDYADLSGPFMYIRMQAAPIASATFRMDHTSSVAGYFPSTLDKQLDINETYPEQSVAFKIKSVGLYGDTIQIGGILFTVTDGKITGTDRFGDIFTSVLRGAELRFIYNSTGAYTVSVNGHEITDNGIGRIYFGGEWSLTCSISTLTEHTSNRTVWAPGQFAFDKEDFAACGLLVAGACLVGLGMTGSRSGTKMGLLLLICGGAGLIYLTLL